MDLSTSYLGLDLRSPLVASASPLSESLDNIKRLEEAGAAAIVMHSLFEEQLTQDSLELDHHLSFATESYAESLSYFPEPETYHVGPELYLDHITEARAAVDIPIIASLNGHTHGGWLHFAKRMEIAGANALELNLYDIPTNPSLTAAQIESGYLKIIQSVIASVKIPVAVKLSPFFTNLVHFAHGVAEAGARGLVLFNRFYQPDINLDTLEIEPHLLLSSPQEMRLPLNWIGILYGRTPLDLAATTGVHQAKDVIKMMMVGANVTMMASVLLRRGPDYVRMIEEEIREWMAEHEYSSIRQMQGSMSQKYCADPSAFERVQYMKTLQSYRLHISPGLGN